MQKHIKSYNPKKYEQKQSGSGKRIKKIKVPRETMWDHKSFSENLFYAEINKYHCLGTYSYCRYTNQKEQSL